MTIIQLLDYLDNRGIIITDEKLIQKEMDWLPVVIINQDKVIKSVTEREG